MQMTQSVLDGHEGLGCIHVWRSDPCWFTGQHSDLNQISPDCVVPLVETHPAFPPPLTTGEWCWESCAELSFPEGCP